MRIIRFEKEDGEQVYGVSDNDVDARLIVGDIFADWHVQSDRVKVRKILKPLDPVNIFCIGLNYKEHAKESGERLPSVPLVFSKPTTAAIGPDESILIPSCTSESGEVDFECELAVIIGKMAKNVEAADSLEYVLGYTAANDVSAREIQIKTNGGQWFLGKSFDTFCPIGPAIVTTDEIPDPQNLNIRTVLNGQTMQNENTADMIFPVAEIVSFLSKHVTLMPGTIILTGTPKGVGFTRKPPVFLKPEDSVSIVIDRIGELRNSVQAGNA